MKAARKVFFGLVVVGAMVYISGTSFAQTAAPAPATANDVSAAQQAKHDAKIKLLQDSAVALQATNPDLAKKLSDFVNEETNESKEKLAGSQEKVAKGSPEWQAKHDAKIQLYKDAAVALQATRPDLAMGLMDMTLPKQKAEMQKAAEEKNVKEEAGEKVEPKGDK